jgi:hypothetical protein
MFYLCVGTNDNQFNFMFGISKAVQKVYAHQLERVVEHITRIAKYSNKVEYPSCSTRIGNRSEHRHHTA